GPVGLGFLPHVVSAAGVVLDQGPAGTALVGDVLAEVALAVLEGVDAEGEEAPLRDLLGAGAGVLEGGVGPAHVVGDVLLDVAGVVEGLVHVVDVLAQVVAAAVVEVEGAAVVVGDGDADAAVGVAVGVGATHAGGQLRGLAQVGPDERAVVIHYEP